MAVMCSIYGNNITSRVHYYLIHHCAAGYIMVAILGWIHGIVVRNCFELHACPLTTGNEISPRASFFSCEILPVFW